MSALRSSRSHARPVPRSGAVGAALLASLLLASSARAQPAVTEDATEERSAPPPKPQSEAVRLSVYGSAGFPSPINVGGGLRFGKVVQLGFEFGFLPHTDLGPLSVDYQTYSGDLRIWPWPSGPFYLGARVGQQKLAADYSQTVAPYGTANGTIDATGWYLNPRIGLQWTNDWGLTAGIDAGFRLALSHQMHESGAYGLPVPSDASSLAHTLVSRTIPTVTLLQLGLVF